MDRRNDVRNTYDRIAGHFAKTRPDPWPEVRSFLDGRTGAVGLDVGIGNARHAELLATRVDRVVGVDLSAGFLSVAAERARQQRFEVHLLQADAATLPIRDACVDVCVYVATIHHLPSRDLRVASLNEVARVLASDGSAIVSAWAVSHETFDRERGFDTTVDWTLPDGETVPRFYHVYDLAEFRSDLAASDLDVADIFEASGNCYAIVG